MSVAAEVEAPAKINLLLRVFERRPDGFHELETAFQAIDLQDHVRVERARAGVELEVSGAGTDLGPVEENLAYRAAARLLPEVPLGGARIRLEKRIPAGAGLGGGSSDAAAVLRCIAALAGISGDDPRLAQVGAELGSDVPFFLGASPLAAGRGRGEVLDPITPLPPADLVIVTPPVHISTAWAYRALDASRARSAAPGRAGGTRPPKSWDDVAADAQNDFQALVTATHPEVARALEALERAGARPALMSGSGSAAFGVFPDRSAAERASQTISTELGWPCRVARTLSAFAAPRLTPRLT